MKITIVTSLFTERDVDVNSCHPAKVGIAFLGIVDNQPYLILIKLLS
jgi:hypothetical protein